MDKKYEAIFIIKNYENKEALEDVIERINNIVASEGGTICLKNRIGIKRLAYEVKGHKQGYYYLINFKITQGDVGKISMNINTLEDVIKHITVKVD